MTGPYAPDCSVVIRTKTRAAYVDACLASIRDQTYSGRVEVIVVDSGSTDGTAEAAERHGVNVIRIPAASFTYGYALNVGIAAATGEITVALSSHTLPALDWLEHLVAPFADPAVAGVYGRQAPHPDCNPLEMLSLEHWYPPPGHPGRLVFSNANGAIRRSCWQEQPFDERLPYNEDIAWAKAMQRRGHAIQYAPRAVVEYARDETLRQMYWRAAREAFAASAVDGPSGRQPVRRILGPVYQGQRDALMVLRRWGVRSWPWALRAIPRRAVIEYGSWRGERDYLRGAHVAYTGRR